MVNAFVGQRRYCGEGKARSLYTNLGHSRWHFHSFFAKDSWQVSINANVHHIRHIVSILYNIHVYKYAYVRVKESEMDENETVKKGKGNKLIVSLKMLT